MTHLFLVSMTSREKNCKCLVRHSITPNQGVTGIHVSWGYMLVPLFITFPHLIKSCVSNSQLKFIIAVMTHLSHNNASARANDRVHDASDEVLRFPIDEPCDDTCTFWDRLICSNDMFDTGYCSILKGLLAQTWSCRFQSYTAP